MPPAVVAGVAAFLVGHGVAVAQQPGAVSAQPDSGPVALPTDETLEARVTAIVEERLRPDGSVYQRLQMEITSGDAAGEAVVVENGTLNMVNQIRYRVGDHLVITRSADPSGQVAYFITDYVRRDALAVLALLFIVLTIAVGRVYGAASLVGMALSFLVVFRLILPQILSGRDPVVAAIAGSAVIVPVTFYLSHGPGRKTSVAIAGTLIALVITGILAVTFVDYTNLSGFADEDAAFLQIANAGQIDMQGLLLAGIIIASLGVLDDITVSQASIVAQLREANPLLSRRDLYRRAMRVGQDHIASAVNTLVLVYAGASLPLLLLFVTSGRPILEVVNYEFIAEEIVRTLVGCIGLVAAVPLTTVIAAAALSDAAQVVPPAGRPTASARSDHDPRLARGPGAPDPSDTTPAAELDVDLS